MSKFVGLNTASWSEKLLTRNVLKLRDLGLIVVLAIVASFAVAIPSQAATVSAVFPESGPNIGGTSVTVTGSGFGVTGTPAVTVGGTAATSIARQSDTQITFVTPAGEGVSDIVITPTVGDPVTVTGGFTFDSYLITPVIETIHPSTVGQTGGEVITITGKYLNYVSYLTVGNSYPISWEYFTTRDTAEGRYISFVNPYQSTPGPKDIKFYGGDQTVTEFAGLTYATPEITKITPNTGSASGTTAVVIDGVGFSSIGTLTVTAGGSAATGVTRVSPTQIKATFPANTAGLKDVVVTLYNAGSAPTVYPITKTGGFYYMEASSAPTLTAVLPAKGPAAGGNTATLYGTNLRGTDGLTPTITFDGIPATNVVVAVDRKSANVTVPAHASGAVTVSIQTNNGSAAKPSAYTYAVAPTITSIVPNSGVVQGGTAFTINGTNFGAGSPVVTVGGQPALCTKLVSPTQIDAVTPPGAAGPVDVVVDPGTGVGHATSTSGYSYVAAATTPAITSISPSSGLVTGGTSITITTSGTFPAGTPTVLVGNICAINVTRVSNTVVTATTPVGTAGAKDVSLTFATSYSLSSNGFTYAAAPAITAVSPARGGTTGLTAVTITGVGFGSSGTPTVTFGGVAATSIVRVNDNTITAVTPPNSSGAKAVVVTPAAGSAITKASAYTYDLPAITLITPNSGATSGGNRVIIDGTGFGNSGTPTVTFGGIAATNIVRESATRVIATTPVGVAGKPTVVVTPTTGTGAASSATLFTYLAKRITPVITSQSPSWVSASGGTRVYITGANFRNADGTPAVVKVDGVTMTGVVVSADGTSLSFLSTAMESGWHTASVETGEGIATHVGLRVAWPASFGGGSNVCDAVSPWSWNPGGGTTVHIYGSDFGSSIGLPTVLVGGVEAEVTDFTDTHLQFTDPGGPLGHANIQITFANANSATFNNCAYRQGYTTITAVDKSINYGQPTPTFTRTVSGMYGSDTLTGLTYTFEGKNGTSYGPSTEAPTAAGEYRIIPSNGVVTPGSIDNYAVNYVEGTFTIEGIPATVTAADKAKQYGAANPTFTAAATGLITGHSLTGVNYVFEGIGGTSYGPSTTVPTAVGTYSITPSDATVTGGAQVNYSFTYTSGTYTITPRAITVTAANKTKVYGQSDPELTYSVTSGSLVDGESLTGWLSRDYGEDVGSYAITIGTLADWNPNYAITYVGAHLSITAKTITVTADDQTKGYGESDPELTYSSAGLLDGDTLSGALTRAAGQSVGHYVISRGTLTGGSNYVISTFTPGDFEITTRALQLTVDDQEVVYGNSRPANSFQITDGGLAAGDSISSLSYSYSTSTFDVGTHTISGATPVFGSGSASNYSISIVSGTLTVTPRPISVSADNKSKTYGNSDPAFTYTVEPGGLVGSDTLSGSLSRDAGEDIGEYAITPGSLSAGGNYELTVTGGVLSIDPRPITVTADAKSMTYGDNEPDGSWAVTTGSLAGSDTLVGWLGREPGSDAGTYAYNLGVLGDYNPNYNITFVGNNLTINPKSISVTIDDVTKTYGDNDPTFTYSSSGLLDGDLLSGAVTRVSGENVGTYTINAGTLGGGNNYVLTGITAGTLTIDPRGLEVWVDSKGMVYGDTLPANSIGGTNGLVNGDAISSLTYTYSTTPSDAGEYGINGASPVFSSGSANNYSITIYSGTLYIERRDITITADNLGKVYGESDPTLTWSLTGGSLVGSDNASGSLTRDSGEGVGSYAISIGSLTAGNNYNLTFNPGSFTITPLAITVTADAKNKTYGDGDPTATWQVTTGSLVGSDALVGWMGRADGENVGTYAYTIGVLGDYNPNYNITFVSADLTIERKSITVTIDDKSKTYGDVDPTFTYTSSGLLEGDTLSGEPIRIFGEDVGAYSIDAGTLSGGGNYTVTAVTSGTLTIGTRALDIYVASTSMDYGDSVPGNSIAGIDGLTNGDTVTTLTYSYSSTPTNAGSYDINGSSPVFSVGSANNYSIAIYPGTLTVNARAISVSADNLGKQYGGTDPAPTWTLIDGTIVNGDTPSGSLTRDVGEGVATYAIGIGSLSFGANYSLTFTDGTFTISPRPITVTADASNKTYGDSDPTATWQVTTGSLVGSDTLVGWLGRVAGESVGTYAYTIGVLGDYNPNYDINFVSADLTIGRKSISVTIDNQSKTYGDADPTFTYTSSGLLDGDTLSGEPTRAAGDDAGTYAITQGTLVGGDNYTISSVTQGTLTIGTRPITITANDQDMVYGDSVPTNGYTISAGSLAYSDAISTATYNYSSSVGGAGEYGITPSAAVFSVGSDLNYNITYGDGLLVVTPRNITLSVQDEMITYGDPEPSWIVTVVSGGWVGADGYSGSPSRDVGSDAGTYAVHQGTVDAGPNYNLTFTDGLLTINKAYLDLDFDPQTKQYGDSDPSFTYQIVAGGLLGSDTLTGAPSRDAGENVGTYTIGQGTLDNPNYDIFVYTDTLTIDPKPIDVTATDASKYYGDSDPTFEASSTGLINGDQLSGTVTRATGENLGTYALDLSGISAGANYTVSTPTVAYLTIDPRPITVTFTDASKTYGDPDPGGWDFQVTSGTLVGSDSPAGDSDRVAGEGAGTYTINEGNLDFGGNYSVTYITGTFTINPRDITVAVDNTEKMYGDADPSFTFGLNAGTLIGTDAISGTPDREPGDTPGTYNYTLGSVTAGPNYNVTLGSGTLTVTKRPVTVDPADTSKTYGDGDPTFTYTVTSGSFINGDEPTGVLGRDAGEDVGTYAITLGTLAHDYYDITVGAGLVTVNPKDITVTAEDNSKNYGQSDPTLTATSNDLVGSDALSGTPTRAVGEGVNTYVIGRGTVDAGANYNIVTFNDGTFTIDPAPLTVTIEDASKEYGTADPGSFSYTVTSGALVGSDAPTGSLSRTAGEDIGTYPIGVGTLNFGDNYDVTVVNGSFLIDPIAIVLTADDVEKVYGEDDPAFTYTVTSGNIADGDTLTGSLERVAGEGVGEYNITPGTLYAGPNYEVTILSGSLTVTPRPITITAADNSKTYGDGDPALTWDVTTGSIIDGDSLSGSLSRDAGEDVGDYAITVGSLANDNYNITYVAGTLAIERKPIDVVIHDAEKTFGNDDPDFTYSVDGVDGVTLVGSPTRVSGSNVGTYAINQGTLAGGDNYSIASVTPGTLTINERPITITIDDDSITYGDNVPAATYTVGGDGLAGSDSITSITVDYPVAVDGVGDYAVDGDSAHFGTGSANNYLIEFASGTLTVDPKPVTVTFQDISSGWGAALPDVTWATNDLEGSDSISDFSVTFDGSGTEPTAIGTYVIDGTRPVFGTGDAANYDVQTVAGTLEITGPEFLSIYPPEGFVTGGFPFEITGSGFGTETPTVQFDGLDATDVVLVDSNTITGITPEHVEGLVTVTVITSVETLELPEAYTYIPLPPVPEIFTMFPPEGPTAGGTLVTFSGVNLMNTDGTPAQVTFDGIDGLSEAVSEDGVTLTVRTPEHPIETVDVVISTDGGIITLPQSFSFFEGPVGDINGKLWIDTNLDGQLQPTESMLPNTELAIVREGALDPELPSSITPNRMTTPIRSMISDPSIAAIGVQTYYWVGSTNADGQYDIPALPYGHYVLVYTLPPDFTETVGGGTPGAVTLTLSTPTLEQDLAGAGNSELLLNQIVLQSTGEPVPYAEARLRWSGSDGEIATEDDVIFPVLADENGQFTIEGLVSGQYDVLTYDDDPLMVDPKVVALDAFASIDGEIWELIAREGDGQLASTGFDSRAMLGAGAGLLVLGVVATGARKRRTARTK